MSCILIKNINTLVTMVDGQEPLHDVDLLIRGNIIEEIGHNLPEPQEEGVQIIDGTLRVVYPGFINTHHHLYQTLTRNLPSLQKTGNKVLIRCGTWTRDWHRDTCLRCADSP